MLSHAALALWGTKEDPAPVGRETWRSVPRLNVMFGDAHFHFAQAPIPTTAIPILQRHLDSPMPSLASLSVPAPLGRCPIVPMLFSGMDGHPCPGQTCCKLWEMSSLGGEDEALTGHRGGVSSQVAHLWLQHALCLLHCCTSAPNLITPLIQWLPPSVSPPRVQLMAMSLLPISSLSLFSPGGCAPVSPHCSLSPCQDFHTLS